MATTGTGYATNHIVRPLPPSPIILTNPERQKILAAKPLHIQIHDHAEARLDPDQLAAAVVDQRPGLGVEAAARAEEHIAGLAARVRAHSAELGGFGGEGFEVEGGMGAENAHVVPEMVPGGARRGCAQQRQEDKRRC